MATGIIRDWIDDKRYGFIRPDDRDQRQIFFHAKQFPFGEIPRHGQRVSYDVGEDRDGRKHAVSIRLINDAPG
jgi:CspA family cold shock protein